MMRKCLGGAVAGNKKGSFGLPFLHNPRSGSGQETTLHIQRNLRRITGSITRQIQRRPAISREADASLSWICCTAVFKIVSFFTNAEANLVLVGPGSRALRRIPTLAWAPCRSSSLALASPMSRLAPETKVNLLSSRARTSFRT